MSPRLRLAVTVSFVLNGTLILAGEYHRSYDAYIHMFFADHYRMDWWALWEPRWYTGFSVTSYPPLVHQLIALLSFAVGVDAAFAVVLLITLAAFPLGVYLFARVFSGRPSAEYAALGGAVLPALYYSGHTFGQLPTLFSLLFGLFALSALAVFLKNGRSLDCLLAVALMSVVAASHHATLLLMPAAIATVVLHLCLNRRVSVRLLLNRLVLFAVPSALAMALVVWPFWEWGSTQTMQVPIDHPTRHSYLRDPLAFAGFFLTMYGPLILIIPWALWRTEGRRMLAPGMLFAVLFVLGLGGTTPLPRLLFGQGWAWLTYDRFALWACIVLLVFAGQWLVLVRRRLRRSHQLLSATERGLATASLLLILGPVAVLDGLVPSLVPFEPARLDMTPIVRFLASENASGSYYYLTFGFGDQLALLSRLTPSRTLDGSYHTARPLPELRNSGLAQMDTAFWFPGGMLALDGILDKIATRGARWAFVDGKHYDEILRSHGWRNLTTLSDGVQVWDNPAAPLPISAPPASASPLAEFSWGVLPLTALALSGALALARWRPETARRTFDVLYFFSIGLLPLSLCFWYFRPLGYGRDPRVYMTYGDVLFYASDALILVCVLTWALGKLIDRDGFRPRLSETRWLTWSLLGLVIWCSLSIMWSINRPLSLGFALQLWLLFGLYCSLRQRPQAWHYVAEGCALALIAQLVFGLGQITTQSTGFMAGLGMVWPGSWRAAMRGASVVQLANGTRWLRVYGSLPHPNLLGGLLLLFLAGVAHLALVPGGSARSQVRRRWPAALLFGAGVGLLVLTFSRGAWLGLASGVALVVLRRNSFERRSLILLGLAGLAGGMAAALPFYGFVLSRLSGGVRPATFDPEVVSNVMRGYLTLEAGRLIRLYPTLGSGVGTFVAALARLLPPYFSVEPVHNLVLLALEELGPVGGLLTLTIAVLVVLSMLRARSPDSILLSGLILGLLAIGLFDHYLWTLPPTRSLLWVSLGLMVSQIEGRGGAVDV